jgi:hypothetical protein
LVPQVIEKARFGLANGRSPVPPSQERVGVKRSARSYFLPVEKPRPSGRLSLASMQQTFE